MLYLFGRISSMTRAKTWQLRTLHSSNAEERDRTVGGKCQVSLVPGHGDNLDLRGSHSPAFEIASAFHSVSCSRRTGPNEGDILRSRDAERTHVSASNTN